MEKIELAKKILDYWEIVEMLGQSDLPKRDTKKNSEKVSITEDVKFNEQLDEKIQEKHCYFKKNFYGNITVYIGKLSRELCLEEIANLLGRNVDLPEKNYKQIAWASLQIDHNGKYVDGSFSLSPILFAIKVLSEYGKGNLFQNLNLAKYHEVQQQFEEKLQGTLLVNLGNNDGLGDKENLLPGDAGPADKKVPSTLQKLKKIQEQIIDTYIQPYWPEKDSYESVLVSYALYKQIPNEDMNEEYHGLHMDFYSDDLNMVKNTLDANPQYFSDGMGKALIDYIVSAVNKDKEHPKRINLVPGENNPFQAEGFYNILSEIFDVTNAPLGKWPSPFMPALMQEAAINLFTQRGKKGLFSLNGPVFSVNGPPGTGKTTLLKEIIVNNIVERAKLLVQYDNPKEAFKKVSFKYGEEAEDKYWNGFYQLKADKINEFGVLVTSCNNTAVENISKELPLREKMITDFDKKVPAQKDISDLFDLEQVRECHQSTAPLSGTDELESDIYFSKYAKNLLDKKSKDENLAWGLVAAALGKKANINNFAECVLNPLIKYMRKNDTLEAHLEKWKEVKERFTDQLQKVENMQQNIAELCQLERQIHSQTFSLKNCEAIKVKNAKCGKDNSHSMHNKVKRYKEIVAKEAELRKQFRPKNFLQRAMFWKREEYKKYNREIENQIRDLENENKSIQIERLQYDEWLKSMQKNEKEYERLTSDLEKLKKKRQNKIFPREQVILNESFVDRFLSDNLELNTEAQTENPWIYDDYNRQREQLFWWAMQVHKEFILSSKACRANFRHLLMIWKAMPNQKYEYDIRDIKTCMPSLLQTLWLLVPVISTTFASVGRFLQYIREPGTLGTLIVDEAGQAQPQMAIGSLFRTRKAIIVGDPKQVEPVVTDELDLLKQAYNEEYLIPYQDKRNSVQQFADQINCFGTYLTENGNEEWIGCPLLVHRRCIDPMYSISNELSYNGIMKQKTAPPKAEKIARFALDQSCWMNVVGKENGHKDHFVKAQGEAVAQILVKAFEKRHNPDLYIISPFTSVVRGIKEFLNSNPDLQDIPKEWKNSNIGTVHKFQGKEADEVIFLLGCDSSIGADGAVRWVNSNIVNVAATRAKYRLCVIGDRKVWEKSQCVRKMMDILDAEQ